MSAKNKTMRLAVASLLLMTTACYHVGVVTRSVAPAEQQRRWMHGFIYGLLGSELDTESLCGNRPVARVDTFMSVPNMILAAITAGIYTPMTLVVTCGQGR